MNPVWIQLSLQLQWFQCPDLWLIALNIMWWIILRLISLMFMASAASAAFFVGIFINIRPDISGRGAEILGDMMMMRYARIVARFLCCTRNDPFFLDFLVALRRMPMSHMRTMVLVYKNLQNWVIYGVNVGKYSRTMVRIWVWMSEKFGGPDHQISPGHHASAAEERCATSWTRAILQAFSVLDAFGVSLPWNEQYGSVSKPCTPGEHQNSW